MMFKKDDEVIRIGPTSPFYDSSGNEMIKGNKYIVIKQLGNQVYIKGFNQTFDVHRFELHKRVPMETHMPPWF